MIAFVHERGLCESDAVGDGTRVWAFAHVLPGARIGRDCNICDGVFVENDVVRRRPGDREVRRSAVGRRAGRRRRVHRPERDVHQRSLPSQQAALPVEPRRRTCVACASARTHDPTRVTSDATPWSAPRPSSRVTFRRCHRRRQPRADHRLRRHDAARRDDRGTGGERRSSLRRGALSLPGAHRLAGQPDGRRASGQLRSHRSASSRFTAFAGREVRGSTRTARATSSSCASSTSVRT